VACSNVGFHIDGVFVGAFSGRCSEWQDKPSFGAPDYYEILSFFLIRLSRLQLKAIT
jgi:hypothetical protein